MATLPLNLSPADIAELQRQGYTSSDIAGLDQPVDSSPSFLSSFGNFATSLGQAFATAYQAANPPTITVGRAGASGTPSGASTASSGLGSILTLGIIAVVVIVAVNIFRKR